MKSQARMPRAMVSETESAAYGMDFESFRSKH